MLPPVMYSHPWSPTPSTTWKLRQEQKEISKVLCWQKTNTAFLCVVIRTPTKKERSTIGGREGGGSGSYCSLFRGGRRCVSDTDEGMENVHLHPSTKCGLGAKRDWDASRDENKQRTQGPDSERRFWRKNTRSEWSGTREEKDEHWVLTARAPELRTQNRSPAFPRKNALPEVAPYKHTLPNTSRCT